MNELNTATNLLLETQQNLSKDVNRLADVLAKFTIPDEGTIRAKAVAYDEMKACIRKIRPALQLIDLGSLGSSCAFSVNLHVTTMDEAPVVIDIMDLFDLTSADFKPYEDPVKAYEPERAD